MHHPDSPVGEIVGVLVALLAASPAASQGLKLHVKLDSLESIARRDTNDAVAQYNVALGYWTKKRWDDVQRSLELAVKIEPNFAQAWLALSILPYARRPKLREEEIEKGKVPEEWKAPLEAARRAYRRAFLADPLVDLSILAAIEPPRPPIEFHVDRTGHVSVWFENPFLELEQGRYLEAFRIFDAWMTPYLRQRDSTRRDSLAPVLRGTPARVPEPLLWFHGLCAAHLASYDVAVTDFRILLDQDTTAAQRHLDWASLQTNDYRYMLAVIYQRQQKWPEAKNMFREALEHDLGLYMAHLQMAKIYEAQGLLDSATTESRAAVLANPEDPSLMLHHGVILTEAGYVAAAVDTLWRAMNANPRDSRIPYFLGVAEQTLQERAEARAAFERFLSLAPSRYTEYIRDARARLETFH